MKLTYSEQESDRRGHEGFGEVHDGQAGGGEGEVCRDHVDLVPEQHPDQPRPAAPRALLHAVPVVQTVDEGEGHVTQTTDLLHQVYHEPLVTILRHPQEGLGLDIKVIKGSV